MDSSERQTVRRALDALKPYLEAFLAQNRVHVQSTGQGPTTSRPDMQALLKSAISNWEPALQSVLPRVARAYLHELKEVRNRWAHEEPFSPDEAKRAVDTARVLGELIGAPASGGGIPARAPSPARQPRLVVGAAGAGRRHASQRAVMARIFAEVGRDPERAVREYAAAEDRGEVVRRSNRAQIDSKTYARALLNDGLKKGWLW